MKKICFFLTALFAGVVWANAQNTSPYWSLAGNNNATPASKLGTTNDISLRFYTKNVQRMIINSAAGLVGIGTPAPNSKLHVNSIAGEHAFRAQVNGITKFLVHLNGGVVIGGTLAPPVNGLYVSGNTGIGTSQPSQKLHVVGNGLITGSLNVSSGVSSSQSSGTALYGTSSSGYGVYATSGYTGVYGSGNSYGVYGYSPNNYGVFGSSGYTGVYGNGNSYGVYGFSTSNYGVYGTSSNGVGVYGYSDNLKAGYFYSVNENGIWAKTGRGDKNYAGVFEGNVYTFNSYQTSDKNLKKNIEDVKDAMSIINRLKPKIYEFRNDGKLANMNLPQGRHYGVLAQDLEGVLPNLVREVENEVSVPTKMNPTAASFLTPDGKVSVTQAPQMEIAEKITVKAVNYTELIPVMIKAIQELSAKNDALQNELTELKTSLSKGGNGTAITSSAAFLRQNTPNPFNNNTVISYYIPDNVGYAQIKITDIKGRVIKSFNAAKGEGQINIRAGELPSGTYNYTLYINNKRTDTKQMVLL